MPRWDVTVAFEGPSSSTDNAVARFNSTCGTVVQDSGVTISDCNDADFAVGNVVSGGTWSVDVDATGTDGPCLSAAGTFRFGASQDLRLYHGGTNSYVTGVAGDLVLGTQGSGGGIILDAEDDTLEFKQSGTLKAVFDANGLTIKDQLDLRLEESGSGCSYIAMQAAACMCANYTLTWPAAVAGTCGFALKSTTGGVLSWGAAGGGTTINNKAESRLVTIASCTDELDGEANLTFNGTTLNLAGGSGIISVDGRFRAASGTVGAPALSFLDDTDMGFRISGSNNLFLSYGCSDKVNFQDGRIHINDDHTDTDMCRGLVIQGMCADNANLAFKSSDISHPLVSAMTDGGTNYGQADDFLTIRKKYGARGGVRFDVFDDGGQAGDDGHVDWWIWYNVDASIAHSTSGRGITNFLGRRYGGGCSHVGATTANTNQFVINVSTGLGASQAKFIVDAEGDIHADGALNAYDAYCDAQLARTMSNVLSDSIGAVESTIETKWDSFISYNEQTLIDTGLLGGPRVGVDPNVYDCRPSEGQGVGLINYTGMVRLHNGAIWQLHSKLNDQAEEISALNGRLNALMEGG